MYTWVVEYISYLSHRQLPQTLEEGEMFAKGERWYFFPCFSRKLQFKKSEAQLEAAS